ncbi:DNA oxidative demethylase AlkB [Polaromonas sp.]|uniref:DNA oxidative demethylase AlkB n=1 Tax=Polaromonas sp. TaxID=1869339 RepID=UPI00286BDFDF|nr:DNA oxidative demethylase AlkB [Polaromonas sp.]
MTLNLFEDEDAPPPYAAPEPLAPGAVLLRGFALDGAQALMQSVQQIIMAAPLRHLVVPGGHTMSVAMSNCGALGWTSDRSGYRYTPTDPLSGRPWPAMPDGFKRLTARAAAAAGFDGFRPDACLINRYEPGARLSLHQDRDEGDLSAPIVSVSLGLPAVFLFGSARRSDRPVRYRLLHGDVAVWGGPSRLAYHGVAPMADGEHAGLGRQRINLTFRCAGHDSRRRADAQG